MAKKTKNGILHFADFKSPCRGNFINSLEALRARLEKSGKTVVYLFPAATAQRDWAQELGRQATVYFLSGSKLQDILLVRKIIRRHDIGIIHSHFYKLAYLFVFDVSSAFLGVRQVVHLHCALYVHHGIAGLIEKLIMRGKVFIGCSDLLGERVKKQYPKNRAYSAKNAIFFPRLNEFEPTDKKSLGLSESAKTLMMFGFLFEVKGVDLALEAVSSLNEAGGDYQLILILTSHIDEIKQKILSRFGTMPLWLHLLPPRNDIAAYYSLCDAFLAPSRSEGLPYSVLEASYLLVPVVLSDIPPHASLSLPCGYYFRSEDVEDLKRKTVLALSSAPHRSAEFDAQALMIQKEYNLSEWTGKIMHIYNEL